MTDSISDSSTTTLDAVADPALADAAPVATPIAAKSVNAAFAKLDLASALLKALDEEGYHTPTPIQAKAIPPLLAGRDLLGLAETGTGKTAAFALPILQMLNIQNRKTTPRACRALILAPTRELAIQIGESLETYGKHLTLTHTVIYGGVGSRPQMRAMDRGVDVIVATPGRLLDLISTKHIALDQVTHFVLDEADRMLDMGFIHDVKRIVRLLPKQRQSLLFSATMPSDIASLAADLLRNPERVEIERAGKTVDRVEQRVYFVTDKEKRAALVALMQDPALNRVIVFTRTKRGANRVARTLEAAQIGAQAIHGNKSQNARQAALDSFKSGEARVLVATDIAARGIDIDDISHVINFELPNVPESYVHRIGRTARAGATGIAIALCAPDERPYLRDIERLTKKRLDDAGRVEGMEKFLKMPEPPARKDEDDDKPSFQRANARIDSGRRNNRPFDKRPDGARSAGARDGGRDGARGGERKPWSNRDGGSDRPRADAPRGDRAAGERKPWQSREDRRPEPLADGASLTSIADAAHADAPTATKKFDPLDSGSRRERPLVDDRARADRGQDRGQDRGERKPWVNRGGDRGAPRTGGGERKPWVSRDGDRGAPRTGRGERKPFVSRDGDRGAPRTGGGERKPFVSRDGDRGAPRAAGGERKPWVSRDGDRGAPRTGGGGERKPFVSRDGDRGAPRTGGGERKPFVSRDGDRGPPRTGGGDRKPYVSRDGDRGAPRGPRPDGDRSAPRGPRPGAGERKPWQDRSSGGETRAASGDRPRSRGPRPESPRSQSDAPRKDKDTTGAA